MFSSGFASPLESLRRAFGLLVAGPHPVSLDGRDIADLPDRLIPVDELRDLLLARDCPYAVRDAVWQRVITRARAEGGTWTVVAAGLAWPMLTAVARTLTSRYADDPCDVEAEVLRGFLEGLHRVEVERGRIVIRLRWAAYRAGHRAVTRAVASPVPDSTLVESLHGPVVAPGHPDVVLARAVEAGVLSESEAGLISKTRLDGVELGVVDRGGRSYEGLRSVRRRAEARLRVWLLDDTGDADGVPGEIRGRADR